MKFIKDEKLLLIIVGVYTLAATMVTTFANVYLLRYSGSLIVMSMYSLIRYGVLGLAAFVCAKLSTKIRVSYCLAIGLTLITGAVLFLLAVKDRIATEIYLIYIVGFIWGSGEGFFWVTINTLQQVITNIKTRAYFLGISGVLSNAMTIIAPILSTFIISIHNVELEGYYRMFQIAIIIFIFISVLSFFLHSGQVGKPFTLKTSYEGIKTDIHWRYVMVAQFVWGVRDAAIMTLTGLLIYQAVGSSTVYGQWLSLFAVLATISNYVCGRIVNRKNRILCLTIGGVGLFFSGIVLLLGNRTGAMLHGILHYTFLAWIATPFSVIAMNVISEYAIQENLMGRTLAREFMIASGRVLGLFIVIVFAQLIPGVIGVNIGMVILYCFCLLFVVVNRYYHKHSNIQ